MVFDRTEVVGLIMTDRELLELAAKAVSVETYRGDDDKVFLRSGEEWNPLKFAHQSIPLGESVGVSAMQLTILKQCRTAEETRRAVVEAAAEIGSRML